MAGPPRDAPLKTLVVGPPNAGKTSLVRRHTLRHFATEGTIHTIGCEFSRAEVSDVPVPRPTEGPDGCASDGDPDTTDDVVLGIWDLAGQDKSPCLVNTFARGAEGLLVMSDITEPASWEAALVWKRLLDDHCAAHHGSTLPAVFLVNKCDVERCPRTPEQMRRFCTEHGFVAWFETSAKTGEGVDAAFRRLATAMLVVHGARGEATAAVTGDSAPRRVGSVALTEAAGRTAFQAGQRRSCAC